MPDIILNKEFGESGKTKDEGEMENMDELVIREIAVVFVVFFMAVVLHHVIAKTGSILHSIATMGDSQYAVFTFRDDVDLPMSKNVLMNIFIPNVALVLLYWLVSRLGWEMMLKKLWLFVGFYYLYRTILICLVLRRKELYNVKYELCMFVFTVVTEYFVWNYFLIVEDNIFLPISELRNEIWLAVLVIIYKFIEMFVDQVVHQKDVVTEQMMKKYVAKQFDRFYGKYSDCVEINYDNRLLCILLYAIMIFENFNRVKVIRGLERIKIWMGKTATTGIMQVKSDKYLSDEESIKLAYKMIESDIVGEDQLIADEQIQSYAWQYNPSDDYAQSVAFIYRLLKEYLQETGKYRRTFFLENEDDVMEQNAYSEWELEQEGREQSEWLTLDDVKLMTGLKKKEILAIQRRKRAVVLFAREEVEANFRKYMK